MSTIETPETPETPAAEPTAPEAKVADAPKYPVEEGVRLDDGPVQFRYRGCVVEVEWDEDADDPSDWGNEAAIVMRGSRKRRAINAVFGYGKMALKVTAEEVEELVEAGKLFARPLHGYDHGNFTVSLAPFGCRWDSGQVGWVVAQTEEGLAKSAEPVVSAWRQYFEGDVWYVAVRHPETKEYLGGSGGIYGPVTWADIDDYVAEALPREGLQTRMERAEAAIANVDEIGDGAVYDLVVLLLDIIKEAE